MPASKRATWTAWIITAILIALFALSASMKLVHHPTVVQTFGKAGISESAILPIGILELCCIALYAVPRTTVFGTFLLTGYLGGAIVTNLILRMDIILPILLGVFAWIGTWLRVPELRSLIPVRTRFTPDP